MTDLDPNIKPKANPTKKHPVVPMTEVSMEQDKSTRNYLITVILIIFIVVLAGGIAIYWLWGAFSLQTYKNKAQDQTIGLLEQKKKDLVQLKPNYDKLILPGFEGKSTQDQILIAVPTNDAFAELLAMVERMGNESNVKITSITRGGVPTIATKANAGGVSSYSITIAMEGTRGTVQDFLAKTEDSARVLDFISISYGDDMRDQKITADTSFMVYFQGPANISPTTKELQ